MILYQLIKRRIEKERGAIALVTLAFLSGFFSLALATLWTFTQLMGASSYLQATAQTAAYAAINRTNPSDGTTSVVIDCSDSNQLNNYYLCTGGRALASVKEVFRVALKDKPFGLCDGIDSACSGDRVRLLARSSSPGSPSIKAFEINEERTGVCNPKEPGTRIDRDLGTGDILPGSTVPINCWVLVNSRYIKGQNRFVRVAGLNNVRPGVIVRARADITPPLLGLFTSITIEASAVALRGEVTPPNSLDGY